MVYSSARQKDCFFARQQEKIHYTLGCKWAGVGKFFKVRALAAGSAAANGKEASRRRASRLAAVGAGLLPFEVE